ncbi:MAG: hypothetical protein AMXMBFR57_32980 [Acidimicrobiia bacterium]
MQPPQDPFIVEIIRPETPELTVVDVLVGSLGIAGLLAFIALPLGALAGWWLIRRSRRRGLRSDAPSIQ